MVEDIELQHNITSEVLKYTGKGLKIAVMDSSFNLNHPAIAHCLSDPKYWYDGTTDSYGDAPIKEGTVSNFYDPRYSHGNHTIGLIAGIDQRDGKSLGLATGATIIPVCGMNSASIEGEKLKAYYRSLNYLKNLEVDIINLSQEILYEEEAISILIELVLQGKIITYAAGNNSTCLDTKHYSSVVLQHPILRDGLIVIGNINENNNRDTGDKSCIGSNYVSDNFRGNFFWTRGTNRLSASGINYMCKTGTSMAAPTVAGAAALIWEQNPHFTNKEVIMVLVQSGMTIKYCQFPKLDVTNMLLPATQEKILEQEIEDASKMGIHFKQEIFPDITISINDFECLKKTLRGEFSFRKLTQEEIVKFGKSDLLPHMQQEDAMLSAVTSYAYYGLFQNLNYPALIMPVLALCKEENILFLAYECLFLFSKRELIFNELAFQLAQHLDQQYIGIFANWGKFLQSNLLGRSVQDLRQPSGKYFEYIHAQKKEFDSMPNIIIENKDIADLYDDDFLQFYKQDNESSHDLLLDNPDESNYLKVVSPNFHSYIAVFRNNNIIYFDVFLNQKKQIIVTCDAWLTSNWYIVTRILNVMHQKAADQGFEVFFARLSYDFSLPFFEAAVDLTPMEEGHFDSSKYSSFRLDEINFYGKVGEFHREPSFLDAIMRKNYPAINYYLEHHIDLNQILSEDGDSVIHTAIRYTGDFELIKRFVDAGADISKKTKYGLSPIKLADQLKQSEISAYLREKKRESFKVNKLITIEEGIDSTNNSFNRY